jgi:hypothetical protein
MPAGYTEIKYNDVVLKECLTKQFLQEPVWDKDGQTLLYQKFTVTVQGYFVSGSHTETTGGGSGVTTEVPSPTVEIESVPRTGYKTAGKRYGYLADNISARRKKFVMTVGKGGLAEQVILRADPPPGGTKVPGTGPGEGPTDAVLATGTPLYEFYDRNGGPRVRNLQIDEIVANETFRVNVTFEVCIRPEPTEYIGSGSMGQVQRAYGVLSNRWSCIDSVDKHRYTTRTYQGQIVLSSPFMNPHEFRFLALPPIEPGMMRKQIEFAAQADGLRLSYTIKDEEVTATPIGTGKEASDGVHMHVTQDENIAQFGTHVITNFTITLAGTARTDRKELMRMAAVYADAKLALHTFVKPLDNANENRAVLIESYRISEEFDSGKTNKVRLAIQIRRHKSEDPEKKGGMLKQVFENFGNDVDGTHLAGAAKDPALSLALRDYDRLRSWGNRKFPSSYLDDEIPAIEGTMSFAAALSCHLQSINTYDFSMCTGVPPNQTRTEQLRDSRYCDATTQVRGTVRNHTPLMKDEAYSAKNQENCYQSERVESEYREDEVVVAVPVAREADQFVWGSGGSGGTGGTPQNPVPNQAINNATTQTKFIQLAPPQCLRIVRIEATRWGAAPRLPPPMTSFEDKDKVGHSLVKKHVNVAAPRLTGNGDMRVFTIHAEYVYAMSHSPKQYLTGIPDYESGNVDGITQFVLPVGGLFSSDRGMDYEV